MCRRFLAPAVLLLAWLVALGAPQAGAAGAETGPLALDRPYWLLRDAFLALDAGAAETAFEADAVLLFFRDGKPPQLRAGRAEIRAGFQKTMDRMRTARARGELTVRLTERRLGRDVVYDRGFFRLVVRGPTGVTETEFGSMMLELRRSRDGQWRHRVDANGPADRAAFDGATAIRIYE